MMKQKEGKMSEERTLERAIRDKKEGKSPATQAGEFVREEIEHIRRGVHGARSTKQAIAIGLSKARRAGVQLPPSGKGDAGRSPGSLRKKHSLNRGSSRKRANASLRALRREGHRSVSRAALSRFAAASASERGAKRRHQASIKAARTRSRTRAKKRR
jgi:Family of unknown function (DUF6496)